MNLNKRVDNLQAAFEKHLEESGEIRTDLKWLKKSYWALVGVVTLAGGTVVAEVVTHIVIR